MSLRSRRSYGLWASMTREPLLGTWGATPFGTDEAIGIRDALRAQTISVARQMFLEDRIGSIEVGKAADIAVWDRDPYAVPTAAIKEMVCVMTIFDGRVVWEGGLGDAGGQALGASRVTRARPAAVQGEPAVARITRRPQRLTARPAPRVSPRPLARRPEEGAGSCGDPHGERAPEEHAEGAPEHGGPTTWPQARRERRGGAAKRPPRSSPAPGPAPGAPSPAGVRHPPQSFPRRRGRPGSGARCGPR